MGKTKGHRKMHTKGHRKMHKKSSNKGKTQKHSKRQQKGGESKSVTALVGYPYDPSKPGTWPGAASAATWSANKRLDTHGMTMSNYIGLSPYGIPVGGVEVAMPSKKATKQCGGGKKSRKTRRKHIKQKGGAFFLTDIYNNALYRLQGAGESLMSSLSGTKQPVDSSVLVQPIGEKVKLITNDPVNFNSIKRKAEAEVAELEN